MAAIAICSLIQHLGGNLHASSASPNVSVVALGILSPPRPCQWASRHAAEHPASGIDEKGVPHQRRGRGQAGTDQRPSPDRRPLSSKARPDASRCAAWMSR